MSVALAAPARSGWKDFFHGTHRACSPEETWERIRPLLGVAGITRVGDTTRLDRVGIAVVQAVRPASRNLVVTLGTGLSGMPARVSAAMASLELWHAERIDTAQIWSALGAVRATLGYNPYGLPLHAPHLLNDGMVLDWVQATLLHSGAATLVPRVVAEHDLTVRDEWAPPVFLRSRAGLAAGNTHAEAVLHALYELLAHDAAAAMQEAPERHHVLDLSTVDSDDARRLLDRFASAAVAVTVYDITGDTGVAAFEVVAESHSPHVVARGRACHLDPAVALCRALAAAARERLALLTGVRDDIPVVSTATPPPSSRDTAERQPGMPTRSFADIPSRSTTSFAGDIAELCARIEARGAGPAIVVDLSRESIGLPVVRVVVPGLSPDNGARAA